ncbi:MAG: ATP-dependent zinc metalloprotease FtsH [Phycisphaerae bacterium]|nr:ATP-dependent zinc metalloprotease FtsH [Phycisphaerae bacterium]
MVLCATAESATHVDFRPIAEKPNVRFADIAGLEDAKQEIRLRMILPVLYPAKARHFGIRQGGGLLLYGPPGTGKTMLAKAVATEVDAAFYSVRPSDIMSAAVGQAEANVDRLFQTLRQHKRAVLFLDEVEALIPSRRRNGSTIMRRLVSQILGAADGLAKAPDGHVLLLIGATNEPDMIDPAMLRPGRFDAKIFVGLPDRHARRQILATHLVDHPLGTDVRIDCIADQTEGLSGAELAGLVDTAADSAFLRSVALDSAECVIAATDFAPQRAIGTPNSLGASLSCLPIPRSINRA